MANESDQRINQLKTEVADAQEKDEEHETVLEEETQVIYNTAKDFH